MGPFQSTRRAERAWPGRKDSLLRPDFPYPSRSFGLANQVSILLGPTRAPMFAKQTEAGSTRMTCCTLALAPRPHCSAGQRDERAAHSTYIQNMDFVYGSNAERGSSRTSFSSSIDLVNVYFWLPSPTTSDRFQRKQLRI